MEEIKILIVDDHYTTIMGLEVLLKTVPNLKIVGNAYDAEEALQKIEQLKPDVILLDIYMPKGNPAGIRLTEIITKQYPDTKVILHTSSDEKDDIIKGYEAGALGYIPKSFKPALLIEAINKVHKGEAYIIGDVAKAVWDFFRKGQNAGNAKKQFMSVSDEAELLKDANSLCKEQNWNQALEKFNDYFQNSSNGSDKKPLIANLVKLTPTELKVLFFAITDSSKSKDIARELDMAVKTVSTHRQNIMNKFNINDFDQIIKELIKNSIIT